MDFSSRIDHTLLSPSATAADIDRLCQEAIDHGFAAVCVLPARVARAAARLAGTPVKVCTVVAFPHGSLSIRCKREETWQALRDGAGEIDAVINLGAIKDGRWDAVEAELAALRDACAQACLKVILETGLLTREEKIRAAQLCAAAGVDFVKTSTGSAHGGATVEDVALLAQTVGPAVGVKASGGIKTLDQARALLGAGASRLGTSHGVGIVADRPASGPGQAY